MQEQTRGPVGWLKKTFFRKNMKKFEFVFTVLISQRYREMSGITGLL